MKTTYIKLTFGAAILLGIYSCKKSEATVRDSETAQYNNNIVADSVSSAATTLVKDK